MLLISQRVGLTLDSRIVNYIMVYLFIFKFDMVVCMTKVSWRL